MMEEDNKLIRKPFEPTKLEEEREKGKRITVRLNDVEDKRLNEDMKILNIPRDSTTLKKLAEIGHNVIHGRSQAEVFKWIAGSRRQKPII